MAIQPLNSKANNTVLPSKPNQNEKTGNTPAQSAEQPKDTVDITDVAKEITKAFNKSSETSTIETKERVSAIKNAIKDGTYSINADKIAEKMVTMEQDHFIDS